jgi:glycosyltransferase involved in cell wall biosynthesis
MKVVGFSFIRNAELYDYPIVEALRSIEPLCDEIVVAVGDSSDNTLGLLQQLPEHKMRIVNTVWDETLRVGGRVLAQETDKAFAAIPSDATWCVYVQGDEALHHDAIPLLREAMNKYQHDVSTEGFLLRYRHFYGSYGYVTASRNWYRYEVRVVRNLPGIAAYRDAQGFRINGRKLKVRRVDAYMHHYGWVKHPVTMQQKQRHAQRFWHTDDEVDKRVPNVHAYDYTTIDDLLPFTGTHPNAMAQRVASQNWEFSFEPWQQNIGAKEKFSRWLEKTTGWRIGEYKNYELLQ